MEYNQRTIKNFECSIDLKKVYKDCILYYPAILPNTDLEGRCSIGAYTSIGKETILRSTSVGNYSSIASHVICGVKQHSKNWLGTHNLIFNDNNSFQNIPEFQKIYPPHSKTEIQQARVIVGHNVSIGERAIILPGITIGNGAIISENSVVTQDVEPYSVVIGTPAQHIKYRFDNNTIELLEKLQWCNYILDASALDGIDYTNISQALIQIENSINLGKLPIIENSLYIDANSKNIAKPIPCLNIPNEILKNISEDKLYKKAIELNKSGDIKNALNILEEITDIYPKSSEIFFKISALYAKINNIKKASHYHIQALKYGGSTYDNFLAIQSLQNTPKEDAHKWIKEYTKDICPKTLLLPDRLDIIVKYLWARQELYSPNTLNRYTNMYDRHIIKRTNGYERPLLWNPNAVNTAKDSANDYKKQYSITLKSLQEKGFDQTKWIPVSKNTGCILDGAHRVASSIVLEKNINIFNIHGIQSMKWGLSWFKNNEFTSGELDEIASTYTTLKSSDTFIFLIWSPAISHLDTIKKEISKKGKIVGEKKLCFSKQAYNNFIYDIYAHDLGSEVENTKDNIKKKVLLLNKFSSEAYVIACGSISHKEVKDIKETIRNKLDSFISRKGFITIHTSDNKDQSIGLAQNLFSDNYLDHLNMRGDIDLNHEFTKMLNQYRLTLESNNIPIHKTAIIGSAALVLSGVKEHCDDIDFILDNKLRQELGLSKNVVQLCEFTDLVKENYHSRSGLDETYTDHDIINNPCLYYYSRGVKIANLNIVADNKKNGKREKDQKDFQHIQEYWDNRGLILDNKEQKSSFNKKLNIVNASHKNISQYKKKKLKIAVCISGQMRTYDYSFDYIKKNLLDHYDCDIFLHTWEKTGITTDVNRLFPKGMQTYFAKKIEDDSDSFLKEYGVLFDDIASRQIITKNDIDIYPNMKSFVIEETPRDYERTKTLYGVAYPEFLQELFPRRYHNLALFYKIFQCNELKKEYEKKNGIIYDAVIKLRPDGSLTSHLNFNEQLEDNTIYVKKQDDPCFIHDQSFYANSQTMDKVSALWKMLPQYWDKDFDQNWDHKDRTIGQLLYYHVKKENINIKRIKYTSTLSTFQQKKTPTFDEFLPRIEKYVFDKKDIDVNFRASISSAISEKALLEEDSDKRLFILNKEYKIGKFSFKASPYGFSVHYAEEQNFSEAYRFSQLAISSEPYNIKIFKIHIENLFQLNKFKELKALLDEFSKLKYYHSFFDLIIQYYRKIDEDISVLQLYENHERHLFNSKALYRISLIHYKNKNYVMALSLLYDAEINASGNTLADILYKMAQISVKLKKIEKALIYINKAITIKGHVDSYIFLKSKIFLEKRDFCSAIDELIKAYNIFNKKSYDYLNYNISNLYIKIGQKDKAKKYLELCDHSYKDASKILKEISE